MISYTKQPDLSRCQEELVWNKLNLLFFQISLLSQCLLWKLLLLFSFQSSYCCCRFISQVVGIWVSHLCTPHVFTISHFSFNKNKYSENLSKVYINSQPLSLECYQDDLVILTYNKLKPKYLFWCKIQNMKAANTKNEIMLIASGSLFQKSFQQKCIRCLFS